MDEANRLITVTQTKNDKPRLIPLTASALRILKRLRQDAPDDELIFDLTRTGRRRRQLMVCFEQAVKNSAIGDFHFHDLRHTFATRLRAANIHEYDISPTSWATRRRRAKHATPRSRAATRTASRKD